MANEDLVELAPFGVRLAPTAVPTALKPGALAHLLLEHRLVVIEGLPLSDDLLTALAWSLGTPQPARPAGARVPGRPEIKHQVAGAAANYDATYWHSDRNFRTTPARATLLQCLEAPAAGGETPLCDGVATLAALDEERRAVLRGWRGIYEFGDIADRVSEQRYSDAAALQRLEDFIEPVVAPHPLTNLESIALAERYVRFEGLNEIDPGRSKLDTLRRIVERGVVRWHRWAVGDVLIWDNAATLHKAEPVGPGSTKVPHRIVVQ